MEWGPTLNRRAVVVLIIIPQCNPAWRGGAMVKPYGTVVDGIPRIDVPIGASMECRV